MRSKHLSCLLSFLIILVVQIKQAEGLGQSLWLDATYSGLPQGVNPNIVHRIERAIIGPADYERLIYEIRNAIGPDINPLRQQNDVLIVKQTYFDGPVDSVTTEISYNDVYVRGVDIVSRDGNVISIRYTDALQNNQFLVEEENDLGEIFIQLNRGRLESYPDGPITFYSPNAPQHYLNPEQLDPNPGIGYANVMYSQAIVLSEAARFDDILDFVKGNFNSLGRLEITGFLNDLIHSWTKWAQHSSQIRPLSAAIVIAIVTGEDEEFLLSEEGEIQSGEFMMGENEESLFLSEEELIVGIPLEEQAKLLAIGKGVFDQEFSITHYPSVIKADPGVSVSTRYLPTKDSQEFTTANDQSGIDIICQVRGDSVEGYFGTSDIWALVEFAGGMGGYVPNSFVDAPQDEFVTSDCLQGPYL